MKVKFTDYYGQYITVHNSTASGNIRIEVRTHEDLNKVCSLNEDQCPLFYDFSLDENRARILASALSMILDRME